MTLIAKVRFASALPALDKEFDYIVPEALSQVSFGTLVKVPFGRDKAEKTAVVTGLATATEYSGSLSEISSIESTLPLLTTEQFELMQAVAARFMGSVGELLSVVMPKRMVRTEKNWKPKTREIQRMVKIQEATRVYLQPSIMRENDYPNWASSFAQIAKEHLDNGQSVLICLPDYRDIENIRLAFSAVSLDEGIYVFGSSNSASQNYVNYLEALTQPGIFVGLRSTVFLPARNLGAILVLDDADESQIDPSSPYWNTRDVALIRQAGENCNLIFCSLSPSAEIVRLIELGYLNHQIQNRAHQAVKVSGSHNRLDDGTYASIAKTLTEGKPALIQIANLGFATALACARCSSLRTCPCGARIWIDTTKQFRCRSCKATGSLPACDCGEVKVRVLRTGSSAMVEWLRKAFAQANVIHSSAEERITKIERGSNLVIATPGSEPEVAGGYSHVVIADASSMVGAPRLRALEKSLLLWANAIEKLSNSGIAVFAGLTGQLADSMARLDFFQAMHADFTEREELHLPPTRRIASIWSASQKDLDLLKTELIAQLGAVITPIPTNEPGSIVFCFNYSDSDTVAPTLRNLINEITSKSKARLPGQRLFRVRMDDPNAI